MAHEFAPAIRRKGSAMRAMRLIRTACLVLAVVVLGLSVLALAGVVVSAAVGMNSADRDTAGLSKLACIICMSLCGPLAGLGVTFLIAGLILHIITRRLARRGKCRKCGYDIRINEGYCPECGTPIQAAGHAPIRPVADKRPGGGGDGADQ